MLGVDMLLIVRVPFRQSLPLPLLILLLQQTLHKDASILILEGVSMNGIEYSAFGLEVEFHFDLVDTLEVVIVLYSQFNAPAVLVKREPERLVPDQFH